MTGTAVIIAGGPSVNIAAVRIIGIARAQQLCTVIAVNDAVYPCWFADHLHACDNAWWEHHNGVPGFAGKKTSLQPTRFDDVLMLDNTGPDGFDTGEGRIRSGSNSGYQAIHYAAQAGAKKIITIGIDFTDDGARKHWFGNHDGAMDKFSNVPEWRRKLVDLTAILYDCGVEVVVAGNHSTLDWLRKCDLRTELFG